MFSFGKTDIKVRIARLLLAESGEYTDQFLRPYTTQNTGDVREAMEERLPKIDQRIRFSPQILATIAHNFIVPDYKTRGVINIPGGWSQRRGRFMMDVDLIMPTGTILKQLIVGYTDYPEFSYKTSNVDPRLVFYINTVFMLKSMNVQTDRGFHTVYTPVSVNDVISGRGTGGIRGGDTWYSMRPTDVYSAMDVDSRSSLMAELEDVVDTRVSLTNEPIRSRSSNRLGNRYLSDLMTSRQKAADEVQYNSPSTSANAIGQTYISEQYNDEDIFVSVLSNIKGDTRNSDMFEYRDLMELDPNVDNVTDVIEPEDRAVYNYRNQSAQLDGQEECDVIASLIAMAVPAIMMESGLTRINFSLDNHGTPDTHMDDRIAFMPYTVKSFVDERDIDLTPMMNIFETRLIEELIKPITANNLYDIRLDVECFVFGNVDIRMRWDGRNIDRFITPCFCNSLINPVVTSDLRDLERISTDMDDLFATFIPIGNSTIDPRDELFTF